MQLQTHLFLRHTNMNNSLRGEQDFGRRGEQDLGERGEQDLDERGERASKKQLNNL